MPRDIVRAATTVMQAVNPRPIFDFTKSILPAQDHDTYHNYNDSMSVSILIEYIKG